MVIWQSILANFSCPKHLIGSSVTLVLPATLLAILLLNTDLIASIDPIDPIDYSSYQLWADDSLLTETYPYKSDPLSDPDGDGLINKVEYAFSLNPLVQFHKWHTESQIDQTAQNFDLYYSLATTDTNQLNISLAYNYSLEDTAWITFEVAAFSNISINADGTQLVKLSTPLNPPSKFITIDSVSVKNKSVKKGMSFGSILNYEWANLNSLLKPAWHYSWGRATELHPDGLEFVPQFWNGASVTVSEVRALKPHILSGKIKYLFGFNEPDLTGQANMTVDEAIAKWKTLEQILKDEGLFDKVLLVSPVVASNYENWLVPFLNQAEEEGLRVDHIAIHKYVTNNTNPYQFLNSLTATYNQYLASYNKPIWLKEFSVRSIGDETISPEQVQDFMKVVLNGLESYPWIFRYCWFSARVEGNVYDKQEDSILYDETNNNLTPLGVYYSNIETWQ